MTMPTSSNRVSIRPGVKVLSVLQHLNYKPWFALAEFVDNSIQSYNNNSENLHRMHRDYQLTVEIEFSTIENRITIRDNAAGIHAKDYARAFRPAEIPTDRTGLSEFGMGMKSAACWFSPIWHVRTSAVGEEFEKKVTFDISRIVEDDIQELDILRTESSFDSHFTEICLTSLHKIPGPQTISKIKRHLTDIYRIFLRDNELALKYNGELLKYEQPKILVAPFFKDVGGNEVQWKKDIEFDFGDGLCVHGFAAIRQKASTSGAGFALFRRSRLIQGSGDEGYRPELIFGKPNTFVYQRLFGELHLEGFDVSHTKDGFQWDENELPFLELLKEELSKSDIPMLQQAREHRVQRKPADLVRGADTATRQTVRTIEQHASPVLDQLTSPASHPLPPKTLSNFQPLARHSVRVELHNQIWQIDIELIANPSVEDWLEISDYGLENTHTQLEQNVRKIGLRMSLLHPFMDRYGGASSTEIEPLLRVAAAIGLGEVAAIHGGSQNAAGAVRRNVNELLRNALSKVDLSQD